VLYIGVVLMHIVYYVNRLWRIKYFLFQYFWIETDRYYYIYQIFNKKNQQMYY